MNAFITAENNKLAHRIAREFKVSWRTAFNLSLRVHTSFVAQILNSWNSSVFGIWTPTNLKAVAGYFWGLSHAYDKIGDRGRAIATKRLSKKLYAIFDACCIFSFENLLCMKGVSDKLLWEVVDFFISALKGEFTPRTRNLLSQGAQYAHMSRINLPYWAV